VVIGPSTRTEHWPDAQVAFGPPVNAGPVHRELGAPRATPWSRTATRRASGSDSGPLQAAKRGLRVATGANN